MDIQITFLGTGNAMPTAQRNHPSILLDCNAEHILIDCGEGTQRQLRIAKENPCKITRILLTHLHGDHILGIPGLIKTLEMSEYQKTLKIYGPSGTKKHFELLEKLYGNFKIKHEIHENRTIEEKDFKIQTLPMSHGTPTLAYSFEIKEKRRIDKAKLKKLKIKNSPLLGELQKGKNIIIDNKKLNAKSLTYLQPGKKVSFVLDTLPNSNIEKIAKNADLFICEATFSSKEAEIAKDHKHLTAEQAATYAKKAKAKKLILTHISQRYEHTLETLKNEAHKLFKNTSISSDLQKIKI
ncbi:MAG: ribonuclease Z [Nanoarchaeota archaeon]